MSKIWKTCLNMMIAREEYVVYFHRLYDGNNLTNKYYIEVYRWSDDCDEYGNRKLGNESLETKAIYEQVASKLHRYINSKKYINYYSIEDLLAQENILID